jgi:uncharacterized OB-fold protein
VWEERFGEEVYRPLAERALADALKQAELTPDRIDHLVVSGLHARAVRSVGARVGVRPGVLADDLTGSIGNPGTAQVGVLLADVLDRAEPGQTIVAALLADGVSVLVLRTTDALPGHRAAVSVRQQVDGGSDDLPYATYLSWRGLLDREPPRRPDPEPPYAPPAFRSVAWKFGLVAGRCLACGTRNLPPAEVCTACQHVGPMAPEPLADVPGTVSTWTVDHLAFSPNPPMTLVMVDFDGGGRMRCELTDTAAGAVRIGDRVEMTFRRTLTARGIHNYFWKARPARG